MDKKVFIDVIEEIIACKGSEVKGFVNVNGFAVAFAKWKRSSDGMKYINIPVYDNGEQKIVCIPVQGYEKFIEENF